MTRSGAASTAHLRMSDGTLRQHRSGSPAWAQHDSTTRRAVPPLDAERHVGIEPPTFRFPFDRFQREATRDVHPRRRLEADLVPGQEGILAFGILGADEDVRGRDRGGDQPPVDRWVDRFAPDGIRTVDLRRFGVSQTQTQTKTAYADRARARDRRRAARAAEPAGGPAARAGDQLVQTIAHPRLCRGRRLAPTRLATKTKRLVAAKTVPTPRPF